MKIDRLIGILFLLLQKEKITAPQLAERFEVSRRTINRDIEDICKAGIPLVTMQGAGGGISIAEGFKIDKTLLTSREMQAILSGLKGLDSIAGSNQYQILMEKLIHKGCGAYARKDHMLINLSSYHKDSLSSKIEKIQDAIEANLLLSFDYYHAKGEEKREAEPYLIVFQWEAWYLWGYCTRSQDYRLFKLDRLWNLVIEEKCFEPRTPIEYPQPMEMTFPGTISLEAVFKKSEKWRLIEEYGMDCFSERQDGALWFSFQYANKEHLLRWLLSFGDRVEVLKPQELRLEIMSIAESIYKKY